MMSPKRPTRNDRRGVRFKAGSIRWMTVLCAGLTVAVACGDAPQQTDSDAASPPATSLTSDFVPPVGKAVNAVVNSPGERRIMIAVSSDGLSFTRTDRVISDQANVPDVLLDAKGWLYVFYTGWNVDGVNNTSAAAISIDLGESWVFKKLSLGKPYPADPDTVLLSDETIRMFFTQAGGDGVMKVSYADSADGLTYTERQTAAIHNQGFGDSATFKLGETWHMYAADKTGLKDGLWHATSTTGTIFDVGEKVAFTDEDGKKHTANNGIVIPGGYRMYGAHPVTGKIRSWTTNDGKTWALDPGVCLSGDTSSGLESGDLRNPAVVQLPDGSYLMIYGTTIPN